MPDLTDWIGRHERVEDVIDARPARYMAATLGHDVALGEGDPLPALWHWAYFIDPRPPQELGRDGHPKRGGFLPPVPLPRRMWAGGRFEFHTPLLIGQAAQKGSTITHVAEKAGRSGPLCFVTVRHEISQRDALCFREEHDIVYREDPSPEAPKPVPEMAPDDAEFSELIEPSPVLLYRYSAATFNGHRIHYDSDYARDVEGYEGLVFHGPLTATLLADLAQRKLGKSMTHFEFRARAPISGPAPFHIEGRGDGTTQLWAKRADGSVAMESQARFIA